MTLRPAQQLHYDLMELVNLSRDEVLDYSDFIERKSKLRPDLTFRCQFGVAMQMRRLLTVPATAWKDLEQRWAKEAIQAIHNLRKMSGPQFDLALACWGVRRPGLDAAIKELEAANGMQGQKVEEEKELKPDYPKDKKNGKPKRSPVIEQVETEDEELDPETQAMLDQVLAEAEQLKSKAAKPANTTQRSG